MVCAATLGIGLLAAVAGAQEAASSTLTVLKGSDGVEYTLGDLQQLESVTAQGTFTRSTGSEYTATYTGVPISVLIGNVPADATIRVTASDGYSMNYEAGMLLDLTEGTWILAYLENGELLSEDKGPYRIVLVGEDNPDFSSSLSARMVEQIEVLGTFEEYTLLMSGAVDRLFDRAELEAGIGCPCHTTTVSVTKKGETSSYTGIPLWRLVGWVDDEVFPAAELGLRYNDEDFNDALAGQAYTITLVAADGYSQSVTSDVIARDDRFIVAFKADGLFLDPAAEGSMRFVYDDAIELPEDATLKSVKFLVEIRLELP